MQQAQPSQKLTDFNNDLKALCAKYQYELVAKMTYAEEGAFPRIFALDVSPKIPVQPQQQTAPDPTNPNPEAPKEEAPTPAVDNAPTS